MILYFITSAHGWNDKDTDLFVWAPGPTEALILWRNYYELDRSVSPDCIWIVPRNEPRSMRTVPWAQLRRVT